MSVQAGVWNFDGRPVDQVFLGKLNSAIGQYGPDGGNTYSAGSLAMVYGAFHTTLESRLELQPYKSVHGDVITWDGRLDNRDELIPELWADLTSDQTDLAIVMAAYERWGTNCFGKLVGDWALSIWDSQNRGLLLARDYVGVRHLYYHVKNEGITWCTNLAALVLLQNCQFTLNEDYLAGFLALRPEPYLTPYIEINAVPPGKFVRICENSTTIHSYWSFDIKRRIRYRNDADYEEHFRTLFRQAVRRRLRSDSTILAELSGGLDSSSIVCMADDIIAKGGAEAPGLDTTSRYDSEEPSCDERPYFSKVEEKRGRAGFHVSVTNYLKSFPLRFHEFVAVPGSFGNTPPNQDDDDAVVLQQLEYRVLLSGLGGDEFMGGVPNPRPLLADLVVKVHLRELAGQLMAWSLVKRTPWMHLLCRSLVLLLPLSLQARLQKENKPPPWLDVRLAKRYRRVVREMARSENLGFQLPSQRDYAQGLVGLVRQLAVIPPPLWGCQEKRYPYLDRTLIEFLISVPADQLLRPGQRRSLMRRALANLLPNEILSRATKATTARAYLAVFDMLWPQLENLFTSPLSSGYISAPLFLNALRAARNGNAPNLIQLLRGLSLELWLQDLLKRSVIRVPTHARFPLETNLAQVEA